MFIHISNGTKLQISIKNRESLGKNKVVRLFLVHGVGNIYCCQQPNCLVHDPTDASEIVSKDSAQRLVRVELFDATLSTHIIIVISIIIVIVIIIITNLANVGRYLLTVQANIL